jgi:hypothetical protein
MIGILRCVGAIAAAVALHSIRRERSLFTRNRTCKSTVAGLALGCRISEISWIPPHGTQKGWHARAYFTWLRISSKEQHSLELLRQRN